MRRLIKIIAIKFLLFIAISAQSQGLRIGVDIIPGITQLKGFYETSNRLSISGGIVGIYELKNSPVLSLQSGLLITDKGYKRNKRDYTTINPNDQRKLGDSYFYDYHLNIPLLLRVDYKFLYVAGGINYYYYLKFKSVMKSDPPMERGGWGKGGIFERSSLGLNLLAGFQHNFNDQWQLFTEIRVNTLHYEIFDRDQNSLYYLNYELGFGFIYVFLNKS